MNYEVSKKYLNFIENFDFQLLIKIILNQKLKMAHHVTDNRVSRTKKIDAKM